MASLGDVLIADFAWFFFARSKISLDKWLCIHITLNVHSWALHEAVHISVELTGEVVI